MPLQQDHVLSDFLAGPDVGGGNRHGDGGVGVGGGGEILLASDRHRISLSIVDDGIGFEIARVERGGYDGIGLRNIRGRIEHAGGELSISSWPGRTQLRATLPHTSRKLLPPARDARLRTPAEHRTGPDRRRTRARQGRPARTARGRAVPRHRRRGRGRGRALALAETLVADLMLVDVGMKRMAGILLATLLAERRPRIAVLMLSMYDREKYVVSAIRAGARGYVLEDASVHEVIAAVAAVAAGGTCYSAGVAQALLHVRTPPDELTPREREILTMLAHGLSNKAVARALDISARTVETHRLRLRRKLGIASPSGLLKYAVELGWTTWR